MKKRVGLLVGIMLVAGALAGCGGQESTDAKNVKINAILMKQAGYSEEEVQDITNEFKRNNPGIDVNVTFVAYEALEQKILTSSATGEFDVVLIDAPWTAKFANAGIIKDISAEMTPDMRSDFFQGSLDAVSFKDKIYGVPWQTGTKHFFYNKEILQKAGFQEPPKTWDELIEQAKVIKEKGLVEHPIVWSWAQAEALVCDLTTVLESFGGHLTDKDGNPTFTDANNVKALNFMAESLKTGISNPNSTSFLEDDVVGTFSSGQAAFALNWLYMYAKADSPAESQISGKVGLALIPGSNGVTSATVNGGMGLSVTSASKHPDEAWRYIEYLTSKDMQKKYVKSSLPDWKSLYDAPEIIAQYKEVVPVVKEQYNYIVNRPRVPWYGELSTEIQTETQKVLLGQESAEEGLEAMQKKAIELSKQ